MQPTASGKGTLSIMNAGSGDNSISFDPSKPNEVAKAKHIVEDMLRQGYMLLAEVKIGDQIEHVKVVGFNPAMNKYIVETLPPSGGKKVKVELDATDTKATAVAPIAGG